MTFLHHLHNHPLRLRHLSLRTEILHRFLAVRFLAGGDIERGQQERAHRHAHLALGTFLDARQLLLRLLRQLGNAGGVAPEDGAEQHQGAKLAAHGVGGEGVVAVVVEGVEHGGVLLVRLFRAAALRAARQDAEKLALHVLDEAVAVVLAHHGTGRFRLVEHVFEAERGQAEVHRALQHADAHGERKALLVLPHL